MSTALRGATLQIEGLTKNYGLVKAVDDVSIQISAGEFVTLLGSSGSGKTTTLMSVAGFAQPDQGRILLNDKRIDRLPPYRRDIGMVFQSYALFPHMTVFENIAFPLKMRKWEKSAIRESVSRAIKVVDLEGYEDRYPRQLSGGQQQRIALARAIVFGPSLLLMDEPLGALDKQLRQRLQFEIKRIQQELGFTVIYVTHDQEEALVMSDRVAVMNHGRLLQIGTPAELYETPATRFIASFIGETNFLDGHICEVVPGAAKVDLGCASVIVNASDCQLNESAIVAIRPDRIAIAKTLPDGLNAVPGRIVSRVFVGEFHRYSVMLDNGQALEIKRQTVLGDPVFEIDDVIFAIWKRDVATLLRPEGTRYESD